MKKSVDELIVKDNTGEVIGKYDKQMVKTIKNTVAKGATDEELYMFLQISSMYGLNPFMKEIWFVKNKLNQTMIMTSRDGYLKICKENPNFLKCQSVSVYENDDFQVEMEMAEVKAIHHSFKQSERGKIKGAYAVIKSKNRQEDLFTWKNFREYAKNSPVWKSYPDSMIRKCAEADVLKRFGSISGLVTSEEMGELSLQEQEKNYEVTVEPHNEEEDIVLEENEDDVEEAEVEFKENKEGDVKIEGK